MKTVDIRKRSRRHGKGSTSNFLFVVTVFAGLLALYKVLPHYWNFMEMKEVVGLVLGNWQQKDKDRAVKRFENELSNREMPDYLAQVCSFYDMRKEYTMECWWEEPIEMPVVGLVHTLEFYVHRGTSAKGGKIYDVEDY